MRIVRVCVWGGYASREDMRLGRTCV
jgi:hypothetical protein